MVITSLTRNQVVCKGTWVQIPYSSPSVYYSLWEFFYCQKLNNNLNQFSGKDNQVNYDQINSSNNNMYNQQNSNFYNQNNQINYNQQNLNNYINPNQNYRQPNNYNYSQLNQENQPKKGKNPWIYLIIGGLVVIVVVIFLIPIKSNDKEYYFSNEGTEVTYNKNVYSRTTADPSICVSRYVDNLTGY